MMLNKPAKEAIEALLCAAHPNASVHWGDQTPQGPGARGGRLLWLQRGEERHNLWVKRVNHPDQKLVDAIRTLDAADPTFHFHPRVWAYAPARGLLVTDASDGVPLRTKFVRALLLRRAEPLIHKMAETIAGYHRAAVREHGLVKPHNDLTLRNFLVEPSGHLRIIDFDALVHPAFPDTLPPQRDIAVTAVNIAITAARLPTVTTKYGEKLVGELIQRWAKHLQLDDQHNSVHEQIDGLIRGDIDRPLHEIYASRAAQRWIARLRS